jgi:TolA-binding protein
LRDARLFLQSEQIAKAHDLLTTVAAAGASRFYRLEAQLVLADVYTQKDRWREADSLLTLLEQTDIDGQPFGERLQVLRGRTHIANGDAESAIELLRQGSSLQALDVLALAYETADKPMMAVGVYKKITDLYPGSAAAENALFYAGEVFLRSEDWLAARPQFLRLLDLFPDTEYQIRLQFRLGYLYMKSGRLDEALAAFRTQTDADIESLFGYMEAECLRRQGQFDPEQYQKAILKYNSIAAVEPDSKLAPEIKFRMALTMLDKGDEKDALVSLKQFLILYPKNDLASAATFMLAIYSESQERQKYFKDILDRHPDGLIFDAAVTALQKKDYFARNYQDVINRKARFQSKDSAGISNAWQRIHHLLLAESFYYLQQYRQAITAYSKVAGEKDDELNQKAALGQAWCTLNAGQLDSAATLFDQMRSRFTGENHARASFGLATTHFYKKEYDVALQRMPVRIKPETPVLAAIKANSFFKAGESYYRLEYYLQAIEMWQRLVAEPPDSPLAPEAQFRSGDTFFRANHFEDAIAEFDAIRMNYPEHGKAAESMLKVAQCKFNAARFEAALQDFEQFITMYPENPGYSDALEGIQLCYYQLGQTDDASAVLEKLIEQATNDMLAADARYRLAQNHLESDNYDAAIEAFKQILTLYPGTSYAMDAQFALAQALFAKEDYNLAAGEFFRYIQYFPDSPQIAEALFKLAVSYYNQESYLSASDYFAQIVTRYKESEYYVPALQNCGWSFERLGETKRALLFFQQYIDEVADAEDAPKIELQIARLQADTGNMMEAEPKYNALLASSKPEIVAEAAYRLGMLQMNKDDWDAARRAFVAAVKSDSKENYYRLNAISQLAAIYENEQDWQSALDTYKVLAESAAEETWINAARERIEVLNNLLAEGPAKEL